MKTSILVRSAVLLPAALLLGACGSTHQSQQSSNAQNLTGSYIPQNVQKSGQSYNGSSNLRSVDQNDLSKTGAATPADALRKSGVVP